MLLLPDKFDELIKAIAEQMTDLKHPRKEQIETAKWWLRTAIELAHIDHLHSNDDGAVLSALEAGLAAVERAKIPHGRSPHE